MLSGLRSLVSPSQTRPILEDYSRIDSQVGLKLAPLKLIGSPNGGQNEKFEIDPCFVFMRDPDGRVRDRPRAG